MRFLADAEISGKTVDFLRLLYGTLAKNTAICCGKRLLLGAVACKFAPFDAGC